MNWYLEALRKYAVLDGRARRKEFWFFWLFNLIFLIIAVILDNVLGIAIKRKGYGLITALFLLATLLPLLGVYVRRLHDVRKSGRYLFIMLIPIVGTIWFLVLVCRDSMPGENQYGPNPKA